MSDPKDDIAKILEKLSFVGMDPAALEGWAKGEEFRRREQCYDHGHQWSGGYSSDGYTWRDFCSCCFERKVTYGYPDWWFKPIC